MGRYDVKSVEQKIVTGALIGPLLLDFGSTDDVNDIVGIFDIFDIFDIFEIFEICEIFEIFDIFLSLFALFAFLCVVSKRLVADA